MDGIARYQMLLLIHFHVLRKWLNLCFLDKGFMKPLTEVFGYSLLFERAVHLFIERGPMFMAHLINIFVVCLIALFPLIALM